MPQESEPRSSVLLPLTPRRPLSRERWCSHVALHKSVYATCTVVATRLEEVQSRTGGRPRLMAPSLPPCRRTKSTHVLGSLNAVPFVPPIWYSRTTAGLQCAGRMQRLSSRCKSAGLRNTAATSARGFASYQSVVVIDSDVLIFRRSTFSLGLACLRLLRAVSLT